MLFRRLFCAENILLNDSSVKNRIIVQEYRETFNSLAIVQEFIYISFRRVSGRQWGNICLCRCFLFLSINLEEKDLSRRFNIGMYKQDPSDLVTN